MQKTRLVTQADSIYFNNSKRSGVYTFSGIESEQTSGIEVVSGFLKLVVRAFYCERDCREPVTIEEVDMNMAKQYFSISSFVLFFVFFSVSTHTQKK